MASGGGDLQGTGAPAFQSEAIPTSNGPMTIDHASTVSMTADVPAPSGTPGQSLLKENAATTIAGDIWLL